MGGSAINKITLSSLETKIEMLLTNTVKKREAENAILITESITDLAIYWGCSEPIRVSLLLWFYDRHIKP